MKRAVVPILQLAFTAGVLCYLLWDREKRAQMAEALRRADRVWLAAGMLAYGVVELISAWRWEILLHVQGIFLSRRRVVSLLLIGVFFNFFIPGGTGGDVVRAFYLIKEAPGKGPAAVLSVLIDRTMGLFAMVFLAGVTIAYRWDWLTRTKETRQFVLSALVILGISAVAVGFAAIVAGMGLVHRLPERFPLREKLAEVALAFHQYGRAWRTSLKALGASLAANLGYFFVFYCAARAFQTPTERTPALSEMFAVMPVINTIIALPIGMNGLGVRELLFQKFFNQLSGVRESVAMLIATTGFLLTACWGVIGGVLYLIYRPSGGVKMKNIEREIAAVEHEVAATEMSLEAAEEEDR